VVEVEDCRSRGRQAAARRRRSRSSAASTSRSSARTARARRRCSRRCSARERRAVARLGHGVVPAYFSQHEAELDERGSVLDCVQSMTGLRRPEAQNLLGRFLSPAGSRTRSRVGALGRRAAQAGTRRRGRVRRELPRARRAPTNHLDLESREALEAALENFPATVLLVSHGPCADRCGRRADARDRGRAISSYDGGWADYVRASPLWTKSSNVGAPPVSETGLKRHEESHGRTARSRSGDRARAVEAEIARAGGDRRRPRAAARRGLGRRRAARPPTARHATSFSAARAVGDAVRAGAGAWSVGSPG
jgi:ATP-binding cassette subfamily F protein 3